MAAALRRHYSGRGSKAKERRVRHRSCGFQPRRSYREVSPSAEDVKRQLPSETYTSHQHPPPPEMR